MTRFSQPGGHQQCLLSFLRDEDRDDDVGGDGGCVVTMNAHCLVRKFEHNLLHHQLKLKDIRPPLIKVINYRHPPQFPESQSSFSPPLL